ncbi:low-density lipoprotein receptor 1-like [Ostrea edulis]|uniref:low-density lipoprotein receptor 1-like n=1 Tax=Ostrea edulis TaxID=37623 RepID=UPI00209457B3|nr:low-density lipoprotein receptor 1-like [Ostrea edulis]
MRPSHFYMFAVTLISYHQDVSTTDEKKRWEEYCGKTTNLIPNESLTFQGKNNFGTEKCIIRLKTDPGYLLRLNIRYVPDISGCSHSYLHIGNDAYRTDVDSLTSYKFCDVVWDLEVVSRSEFLWIVYNNSGNVKHSHEKQEIGVQVLKEVISCPSNYFRCSPVQCIPRDQVCDNKIDCQNRRDEYCLNSSFKSGALLDRPACFECADGRCINPVLPVYDEDFEKPLSFLCDGYRHCKDGTDERKDMCYRTKSKVSDLLTCVPVDTRFGINTSVTMWQDRVCDGIPHCLQAQDEASCVTEVTVKFRMNSSVIIILTCAGSLLVVWIACFAYRIRNKASETSSDPFQDQINSRSRIYQSRDSQNPAEVCRLQTVSEEPEKWE